MKKILYIHGYHGSANGHAIKTIRNVLPEGWTIEGIDYTEDTVTTALMEIRDYIKEHNIDFVIGSSFGGFLTLMLPDIERFVINPCYTPSVELPTINVTDTAFLKECKFYEETFFKYAATVDSRKKLIGFFGDADELLGMRYHDDFKYDWGINRGYLGDTNFVLIHSGHHISEDGAKTLVKFLPKQ